MEGMIKYLGLILMIGLFSIALAYNLAELFSETTTTADVSLIPIQAEISMFDSQSTVSSDWIVEKIQEAEKDSSVSAIVLSINSPGGAAVSCMEIISELKKAEKPKIAWIREIAGSCAYMIASECDYILAHDFSYVGGLGVISSYLEFPKIMDKYGVGYVRFVSGDLKDMGTPYRNLTQEEKQIWQEMIDEMKLSVFDLVTANRNISESANTDIRRGRLYLGAKSKEIGLVDELGSREQLENYLKNILNATKIKFNKVEQEKSILDLLNLESEISGLLLEKENKLPSLT